MQNTKIPTTGIDRSHFNDADIAYVRELADDEANEIAVTIGLPLLGAKLYSVHTADGVRMAITDSLEGARASAWEHDLEAVRVH
ncbi:MAG: DUF1150 family protein [Alphaproteobacteria bacterium]